MINRIYKLIKSTEKYTKTDMIYIFRGGFWLTLGQIVSSLSSFILVIIFANFLPKEDYGIYKYIFTVIGVLSIPNLRNMNVSITQAVALGNDGTALVGIKKKIKWGFLGGIGSLLLGVYYLAKDNTLLGNIFLLVSIFIPLKDSFGAYNSILVGKKKFKLSTIYNSFSVFAGTLITILVIIFTKNLYLIIFSYFLFWTIINFFLLKKTLNKCVLNNSVDNKAISYGEKASIVNIISSAAGYLDKLLIFNFLGSISVAIYSIALAPISQIIGFTGNINTLASPKFSVQSTENLKKSIENKERNVFLISLFISIIYIILAKTFFTTLLPKYIEAINTSQILAISIPFIIISRLRFTAIQSRFDQNKYNTYIIINSITQIIMNLLGVYLYGLNGIVYSYVIISIIQYIITKLIMRKL